MQYTHTIHVYILPIYTPKLVVTTRAISPNQSDSKFCIRILHTEPILLSKHIYIYVNSTQLGHISIYT